MSDTVVDPIQEEKDKIWREAYNMGLLAGICVGVNFGMELMLLLQYVLRHWR